MSILLQVVLPAGRKWREAENVKLLIRNICGFMSNNCNVWRE